MGEDRFVKTLRVRTNAILNFLLRLVFILSPLVVSPWISRVLGAEGVGEFAYINSVATFFVTAISFGFTNYATKKIAEKKDDPDACSSIFWNVFFSRLIIGAASIALYAGLTFFFFPTKVATATVWLFVLMLLNAVFDVTYFFRGIENYTFVFGVSALFKIASVVLVFVLVRNPEDLWIYTLLYTLGIFGGTIICFAFALFHVQRFRFSQLEIKESLAGSFVYFVPTVAVTLYSIVDKTMLGRMAGEKMVGYYEQASKLYIIASQLIGTLFPVMLARISGEMEGPSDPEAVKKKLQKRIEQVALVHGMIAWPAMFGLFAAAKYIVPAYFGSEFLPSIEIAYILAPLAVLSTISAGLMSVYFVPKNRVWQGSAFYLVGAVLNLGVNFAAIHFLEARGAALTSLFTELLVSGLFIAFSRKEINYRRLLAREAIPLLSSLVMFAALFVVDFAFLRSSGISAIAKSLIMIGIGGLVYLGMLVLLRFSIVESAISALSRRFLKTNARKRTLDIGLVAGVLAVGAILTAAASISSKNAPLYVDIETEDQLFAIADNLNGNYRIKNDIRMTRPWKPLGTKEKPFTGILQGKGHWLYDFVFDEETLIDKDTNPIRAMFGYNKGYVHSVFLEYDSPDLTLGDRTDNGILSFFVGVNEGYVTSCRWFSNRISVGVSGANLVVGSFAGINKGQIKNCYSNSGFVLDKCTGECAVGGLTGIADDNSTIDLCRSRVSVNMLTVKEGSSLYVGGVSGVSRNASYVNVYAFGSIKASHSVPAEATLFQGGLIGKQESGAAKMSCCVSNESFYRLDGDSVGGFVGFNEEGAVSSYTSCISECAYMGEELPVGGAFNANGLFEADRVFYSTSPSVQNEYLVGQKTKEGEFSIYGTGLDETYWAIGSNGKVVTTIND